MPQIVTAGPGFHIGDCMLAQTIDGDRVIDKKPNVIQGHKLEAVRLANINKKIAVGDGLKACACNQLDISWLPLCAESYHISPNISDYVLTAIPIVIATYCNRNLDAFPYEELTAWRPLIGRACYGTFIGKPVHQDHQNEDPTKAKGVIFDATLAPFRGKWHVSILKGFDRSKDARLAKLVQEKNRIGHSMGTLVERTECSAPWCRFISDGQTTCEHIRSGEGKGQVVRGHLIYELLRDFNFVESSSVEDPASPTALSTYFLDV